jgi:peptide/nickel transport system ATP-binding protein
MPSDIVIKVTGLKKYFELKRGFFSFGESPYVKALDSVDFEIREGEILGLVGESGCGKTTTGRLLTRLENPTSGSVFFLGRDIALLEGRDLKIFRRNIQMVFQDPYESLNPRNTVLQTVMEPLINHNIGRSFEARVEIVRKALEDAGLAPAREYLNRFPHELSGGQRQRVSIARALVLKPRVIIADEPVSMLDVSIRAGVLNLMLDLREKYRIPYLFITHDIAVARYVSDRLAVMYLGKIVEIAETDKVIFESKHPYSQALLSAVPVPDPEHKHGRITIKGEIPSAINVPLGCRFRPRCPKAFGECGWQGEDLAEWLRDDEKFQKPDHPMNEHIDELHPDGFALVITIKEGGSAGKVREFIDGRVAQLKDQMPMFKAILSTEESVGNKEITIPCSSVRLSGEDLAQRVLDHLTSTVDFRNKDHPMYGSILDARREGARVIVNVGLEEGPIAKDMTGAKQSKMATTIALLNDLVNHYVKMGDKEFKGVTAITAPKTGRKVTVVCSPAKMPAAVVARETSELIQNDLIYKDSSPLFNTMLPPRIGRNSLKSMVYGQAKRWDEVVEELKAYFKSKSTESAVARGLGEPRVRSKRGPKDTVVVRFIKIKEPPLVDLGGGQRVACYLYK